MSNGRKHYKAMLTGPFGVAEKIKTARKNPNKRKFNKRKNR